MFKLPNKLIKPWTEDILMVDKLDWTVLPKEKDPPEDSEEIEVDSVEDLEDQEVDSEETILETKETLQLFLVKMIKTQKKEPLEHLPVRKLLSDRSFKNFIFTIL